MTPSTEDSWLEEIFKSHPGMSPHTQNSATAIILQHEAAAVKAARLDELEGIARVYNSLPELSVARENTCISLFARIRQLKAELRNHFGIGEDV